MDGKTKQGLEKHRSIKPLPVLLEVVHLGDARNAEPNVIGQVPRLMDAIVFVSPRPNVVQHENMQNEVFFARVPLLVLVEHWTIAPGGAHKEPQKQKHEYVKRQEPQVPLKENSDRVGPEITIVLLMLLEHRK